MTARATLFSRFRPRRAPRWALALVLGLAFTGAASAADESRRGSAEDGEAPRRDGIDGERESRRGIEGSSGPTAEEKRQKEQEKVINLQHPPLCRVDQPSAFRDKLLSLPNPSDDFTIEVWGNNREFFVHDNIYYYMRANRTVYVSLFWIGPEGSIFIPFMNLKLEDNRNHKIDPSNIIVEPVGLERWRVIATTEPHHLPCVGTSQSFLRALENMQKRPYAVGTWDVWSHHGTRPGRYGPSRLSRPEPRAKPRSGDWWPF